MKLEAFMGFNSRLLLFVSFQSDDDLRSALEDKLRLK